METKTTKTIFDLEIPLQSVNLTWDQSKEMDRLTTLNRKRWINVDDILKRLRTIEGGNLASRPDYTIAAIQTLIKELEART